MKKKLNSNILVHFLKNEQGVYTIIMGLISIVLIGFVALIVDGTGMLLDKARFNQGMEQAGLFLVAENNEFRENQNHYDVTERYKNTPQQDFKSPLAAQQDKRNKDMIKKLVQNYYLPNSYNYEKITDKFSYKCGRLKTKNGTELKSVACEVAGEFDRPSWMFIGQDGFPLSFAKTVKIKGDTVYVQKNLDVVPLDVMLVLDFTGSMRDDPLTGKKGAPGHRKIDILRDVIKDISDELLSEDIENREYNRLGFTSFALGAQQSPLSYCYLPYKIRSESYSLFNNLYHTYGIKGVLYYNRTENYLDYDATIQNIQNFDGNDLPQKSGFYIPKQEVCLGNSKTIPTTKFWYSVGMSNQLNHDFNQIRISGATLSSSGLLIGANYLLNKNTDQKVQPEKLGINTKRILLLMSDGIDDINVSTDRGIIRFDPNITTTLINKGMCEKIREKLDSLQDPRYDKQESKIAFVAFGFKGAKINSQFLETQINAWKKCVGENNVYFPNNKAQLLESFRQIIGLTEEVGHSSSSKPNF